MKISFLAIGNEISQGKIQEQNARFLAQKLEELGLGLKYLLVAGDREDDLTDAFQFLQESSDVIICSGGLGPTPDDLTAQVFSKFAQKPLELHPEILEDIKKRFQLRGMKMPPSNQKQAMLPGGAKIIPNYQGTAPGFELEHNQKIWCFFPGVPREFQAMTRQYLIPRLKALAGITKALAGKTLRVYGLAESQIADILAKISFPPEIYLAYLPDFPEIHLRLSVQADSPELAKELLNQASEKIKSALKEYLFSDDDQPLEKVVGDLLRQKGKTLAVAESCTGGLLAKRITDIPGSSDYFLGGFITYSNQLKISQLGVSEQVLKEKGAVSSEVATMMAKGAREKTGADLAVGITGIAGPGGESGEKPVGTVHIALADEQGIWERRFQFLPLSRETVRILASETALEIIRRRILGLRMPGEKNEPEKEK